MDYIVHGVTKSWAFWAIFTYISTYNNYYHLTWEHSMPNRWEQSWPVEEHREEPDLQEMIPGASQILFCASYWFFSKPIIFWRSCGLMHGRKLPCKLQMAEPRFKICLWTFHYIMQLIFPQIFTWSQRPHAADTQLHTDLLIPPEPMTLTCEKQSPSQTVSQSCLAAKEVKTSNMFQSD